MNRSCLSLKNIWQKFFSKDYESVLVETTNTLLEHHCADLLHISGLSLLSLGRLAEAAPRLRAAVALVPQPLWYTNTIFTAIEAKAIVLGAEFAREGLRLFPDEAIMHFATGNLLMNNSQLDEAIRAYQQTLALKPEMNDARMNMGNALRRQNLLNESLVLYDEVLQRQPDHFPALINRISTLMELARNDEAKSLLEPLWRAQAAPEIGFMLAMLYLGNGDYTNGWPLYRQRWYCKISAQERLLFRRPFLQDISEASGKHVLLVHEQGFGDSVQFIRYAKLVAEKAGHVSLLTMPPLKRLFDRIDPSITVVTDRDQIADYDFELPLLDAPAVMGTTLTTIPDAIPYLTVPESLVEQRRLPPTARKRIGLCWAGLKRADLDLAAVDARRSMTLDMFAGLAGLPVELVSLQLNDPAKQIEQAGFPITQPLGDDFDFLDTAAVIRQLDLVITVDTAVAHLAAALGVPTWIMSRYDGCWRWLRNRDDSPWYPGVVRLFRQTSQGDWSEPVARMLRAARDITTPRVCGSESPPV